MTRLPDLIAIALLCVALGLVLYALVRGYTIIPVQPVFEARP